MRMGFERFFAEPFAQPGPVRSAAVAPSSTRVAVIANSGYGNGTAVIVGCGS
jgi:hypothetical protein